MVKKFLDYALKLLNLCRSSYKRNFAIMTAKITNLHQTNVSIEIEENLHQGT